MDSPQRTDLVHCSYLCQLTAKLLLVLEWYAINTQALLEGKMYKWNTKCGREGFLTAAKVAKDTSNIKC